MIIFKKTLIIEKRNEKISIFVLSLYNQKNVDFCHMRTLTFKVFRFASYLLKNYQIRTLQDFIITLLLHDAKFLIINFSVLMFT